MTTTTTPNMTSVYEREFLSKDKAVPLMGFKEKPINRLVSSKPIPNILNIESNHLKRNFKHDARDVVPLLEYQLWLEAGKMDKANYRSATADPAVSFDSNMWRNFRNSVGVFSAKKRSSTVSEAISEMYPLNIPAPSQVGRNTLAKYYENNRRGLFKTEKQYDLAVKRADKEASVMKYLRLRSEMRNPPLDWDGQILPPKNFVKYPPASQSHLFDSVLDDGVQYPHLTTSRMSDSERHRTVHRVDLKLASNAVAFNKPPVNRPKPSKLIFRKTHPNFDQVVLEQQIKGIFRVASANKNVL